MMGFHAHKQPSEKKRRISYSSLLGIIVIAVTVLTGILSVFSDSGAMKSTFDTKTAVLTDGWTDSTGKPASLPLKLDSKKGHFFSYEKTLSDTLALSHPAIMFQGKYLNTDIYLDDVLVGSYQCRPEGISRTNGKHYLFVELPARYDGMTLRMEGEMLLGNLATYEMMAPILGNHEQIFFNVLRAELPTMIVVIVVISVGILLLLFSLQARCSNNGVSYFYTSLFSILFAFYTLFSSQTISFFCPSTNLIYVGEFIVLSLLALPLLILLYYKTAGFSKKLLIGNIILVMTGFILTIFLHFFTSFEFRTTLPCTHIIMAISLIDLIVCICFGCRSKEERKSLLITFSPILAGTIGNLTLFYLPGVYNGALLFLLCVLLFIIMQAYHLIRSYLHIWKSNIQTALYQRMAYTDALTGIANRTAFEEKITELTEAVATESLSGFWCICADVNGLKQVNDTLGHSKGDELLCTAADSLKQILLNDFFLYRTGGDEFVLFALNCNEDSIISSLDHLKTIIDHHNAHSCLLLSIAVGYAKFPEGESDTVSDLLKRADAYMYEKKRLMKLKQ